MTTTTMLMDDVDDQRYNHVFVNFIHQNGKANKAGIKVGDVIVGVGAQNVARLGIEKM